MPHQHTTHVRHASGAHTRILCSINELHVLDLLIRYHKVWCNVNQLSCQFRARHSLDPRGDKYYICLLRCLEDPLLAYEPKNCKLFVNCLIYISMSAILTVGFPPSLYSGRNLYTIFTLYGLDKLSYMVYTI